MSEQVNIEQERDRLAKERFPWPHFCVVHPDVLARRNDFKAGFDAAYEIHKKRIEKLREALEGLLYYWTNTPCRFDHNGNCQAHSCFGYDRTCSVADARAALQEEIK